MLYYTYNRYMYSINMTYIDHAVLLLMCLCCDLQCSCLARIEVLHTVLTVWLEKLGKSTSILRPLLSTRNNSDNMLQQQQHRIIAVAAATTTAAA
jgi:hypothetical protein